MNRRQFSRMVLGGLAAVTLLRYAPPRRPYARLINNGKGTWFAGRASDNQVCEGKDALIYIDDLEGQVQVSYRQQVDQLVADGMAEYV